MEVESLSKDQLEDLIKKAQNQIVVVENGFVAQRFKR